MLQCSQTHVPGSSQQLLKRGMPGQIGPQDHAIHEESQEFGQLCPVPSCDTCIDENVFFPGVAVEQSLEGCQHRHVQRGSLPLSQLAELLMESFGNFESLD